MERLIWYMDGSPWCFGSRKAGRTSLNRGAHSTPRGRFARSREVPNGSFVELTLRSERSRPLDVSDGWLPGLEEAVPVVEIRIPGGPVGARVGAAALLARERRGGHEPRQRMRVVEQPAQALGAPLEPGVAPQRRPRRARRGRGELRSRRLRDGHGGRGGLVERGQRGPVTE